MTDGEKNGVAPSLEDVTAAEKASREKFIEDGGPQQQLPDGKMSGEDRPIGVIDRG
ncbi:hypothetical protein ABIE45_005669 [Methylobacterium sp. OAE515]|jgi:hypothetical protein|uniref:hypothetical protein n=1 Tax=Methylobacterium sp. OAE515 TaxID=2817895 RepID=UPI001788E8F3